MLFEMCYRISRLLFLLLLTRESSPTDCPQTVDRPSVDCPPTVGRLVIRKYTDSRSTVGRCIDRRSVDTSADASVDSRPTGAKVHLSTLGPRTRTTDSEVVPPR